MKPLAYARITGLAVGLPIAAVFVSAGRVPPDPTPPPAAAAEISAGEAPGLDIGPRAQVVRLPVPGPGTDAASGAVEVTNNRFGPVRLSVGAAGPGSRSRAVEITIRSRGDGGRLLFRGTPERLRTENSKSVRLVNAERVELWVTAKPRPARGVVNLKSFELQWATAEG